MTVDRRALRRATAPLLAAALLVSPVTAHAIPTDEAGPATPGTQSATEHRGLDEALGAVGLDRAGFEAQSELSDRLSAAAADYSARFPEAFAGVRIVGASGQGGVVRGADGEAELVADARSRGLHTFAAPASARSLDQTADRVADWAETLPPDAREEITTTEVDPESGTVTVVVEDPRTAPTPPADLGVQVRRGGFRPAQGSFGGPPAPEPTPPPTSPDPVPDGSLLGGERYLTDLPSPAPYDSWCSLGFNGLYNGDVVNITARHCSTYTDTTGREVYAPGVVEEGTTGNPVGRFTAANEDHSLDTALITVDPEDATRFRNSAVHALNGQPLVLDPGFQTPVSGQTVCKYGATTGYTCGTVESLDSGYGPREASFLLNICVIAGDSGGVVFSGRRAVSVVSMSNAFDESGNAYSDCDSARTGLRRWSSQTPQAVTTGLGAIVARFPGLTVGAA